MNMPSVNDDNDLFLKPLSSDSPWYPQNIDKVKELLNKINGHTGNPKQWKEEQQDIYREMLTPHHPELSNTKDGITYDNLQLVTADYCHERFSKIPKLSQSNDKEHDILSQTSGKHKEAVESNSSKSTNSSKLGQEPNIATIILDSAENVQILKENGGKLIEDLNGIDNESDRQLLYSTISRSITTEKLNNIIMFLFNTLEEKNLCTIKTFVENVVYKSVIGQDLAQYPSFLPLIINLLAKEEKFVVEQFLVPYISKSETIADLLPFLSKLAAQLQKVDHRKMILLAYLKHNDKKLCNETQLKFLDTILFSSDFDGLKENKLLNSITSYLCDSMHNNEKDSTNFNKNAKLGKFLLNFVKILPDEIPPVIYMKLSQAADLHQSFLKKAITTELKNKTK